MRDQEQETAQYDQPEPDIWDLADQARAEFKENPDNWFGRK